MLDLSLLDAVWFVIIRVTRGERDSQFRFCQTVSFENSSRGKSTFRARLRSIIRDRGWLLEGEEEKGKKSERRIYPGGQLRADKFACPISNHISRDILKLKKKKGEEKFEKCEVEEKSSKIPS